MSGQADAGAEDGAEDEAGSATTLLVRRGHHTLVSEALTKVAGQVDASSGDPAMVRLSWAAPEVKATDAMVIATDALGSRYDDVHRLVVPNVRLSRDADPVTGQPKTFGVGRGAPVRAAALPPRSDSSAGASVTVGVVDTRMVPHDWLTGSYLAGPGEFERETTLLAKAGSQGSDVGHATFIAGLVLQYAPAATLRAAHVLGPDGTCELYDLVRAVRRVARTGVDVLNLSLGCYTDSDALPWPLLDALEELPQGSVVVAAAGNHKPVPLARHAVQRPFWPAALPHVLAVGALAASGGRAADFSNDGSWVDLWATGDDLVSTFVPGGGYGGWASWGGTSFSAGVVSGVIAARTSQAGRISAREAAYTLLDELSEADLQVARPGGGHVLLTRTAEASSLPQSGPPPQAGT